MKSYLFLLSTLLMFVITSCENEITFKQGDIPPKLVMNALINADSLENIVYLNLTGVGVIGPVKDAVIEIRINGKLSETAELLPPENLYDIHSRYRITSRFHPGDQVRIDAMTADGKYHAWSEVTVPHPLQGIEKVDTATTFLTDNSGSSQYMRYKITFNDLPEEKNYYRLVVQTVTKVVTIRPYLPDLIHYSTNSKLVIREDVVLTDGRPVTDLDEDNEMIDTPKNLYGVFDDSRFRNTSYTMTVYNQIPAAYIDPFIRSIQTNVVIRLLSITETEYLYLKALNIVDSDAFDGTLTEPIKYPGNVNGGTGIVGISTEASTKVLVMEYNKPESD